MIQFGKIITKKYDKDGNYSEIEKNIVEGVVNQPVLKTIEERVKVYNIEEEVEEYRKFSLMLKKNRGIIKPSFRLEYSANGRREGYYYVIKCYTKLERIKK